MSFAEILSFILIFNFFQFAIINMFSELFWSSHKFNRTHQNLFVSNLIFTFVEVVTKITTYDVVKKSFFKFLNGKRKVAGKKKIKRTK